MEYSGDREGKAETEGKGGMALGKYRRDRS